jgi:catechol 2,3-dioxygenase-like lactoylglutathione lyase family enzyme
MTWLGLRAENFDATSDFFGRILGLERLDGGTGFAMFALPGGVNDWVEIYGEGSGDPGAVFYDTAPVVGFTVDDLAAAREEIAGAGLELLDEIGWSKKVEGYGWFHFRGPDGNIYALVQNPSQQ